MASPEEGSITHMCSIRVKITLVTIVALLTSILALGGIGILNIGRETDQTSIEKMTLISEKMQQKLNSYFGSIEQSVEMAIYNAIDTLNDLDISLFLTSRTPEETVRLNRTLRAHVAEVERAFRSIAHHTSGVVSYYYCLNSELGASVDGFFWSSVGQDDFVRQPPMRSSEQAVTDTEHTVWYYAPIKAAIPVWVGPYRARELGELSTVSYVAPIYCHGFLIGVLGMDIPLETITEQISAMKIYQTGYLFLMDNEGTLIYHPDIKSGSTLQESGVELDPELFKRSSSGDRLIRYTLGGQPKQLAFCTLKNRFKLGVAVPVTEINASQIRLTRTLTAVAVVILIVFSVLSMVAMGTLTQPLLDLATASRRLANGDFDAELSYRGNDELGAVTQSFRQMRDTLKIYIDDLNSRVNFDALTGVRNRGAFTIASNHLNQEIESGAPEFAIVTFDCNHLKRINDEHGHERGDAYLKAACRTICQVYAHSPVFRLGGDEFGAILQGADYENRDALIIAFDRAADEVNAAATEPWDRVSTARGMAVFDPQRDKSVEQVMDRADQMMYENKKLSH